MDIEELKSVAGNCCLFMEGCLKNCTIKNNPLPAAQSIQMCCMLLIYAVLAVMIIIDGSPCELYILACSILNTDRYAWVNRRGESE